MMRGALLLLTALAVGNLHADPHRFRVHPLPSISIAALAPHPDGTLFLLTSQRSLFRYDGYRLNPYPLDPPVPPGDRLQIAVSRDGVLWVASDHGLAAFRHGRRIAHWPNSSSTMGLSASLDSVAVWSLGLYIHSTTSQQERKVQDPKVRAAAFDRQGRLWFADHKSAVFRQDFPHPPRFLFQAPFEVESIAPESDSSCWLNPDRNQSVRWNGYSFDPPRPVNRRSGPRLLAGPSRTWFLGDTEFQASDTSIVVPPEHRRLPLTAVAEDFSGHLWTAYQGLGLVQWTIDPQWRRWTSIEHFDGEMVTLVAESPQGDLIAATRSHLRRLDDNRWPTVTSESRLFHGLAFPSPNRWLASTRQSGVVFLTPQGQMSSPLALPPSFIADQARLLLHHAGQTWVVHKQGLLRLEGNQLLVEPIPEPHPETPAPNDLHLHRDGSLWLGDGAGVAVRHPNGRWARLRTTEPLRPVRSLALSPQGDALWVALRRGGGFARLTPSASRWTVQHFSAAAGYSPHDTHFIKIDSRGWIWRGTEEGVFVSDGIHTAPQDWLHLSAANGLAGNATDQYGFWEDRHGSIWISGADGVTSFRPHPNWFQPPSTPPLITRQQADEFQLAAPPHHAFRASPFRYRFDTDTDWRTAASGLISLKNRPWLARELEIAWLGYAASPRLVVPLPVHRAWILGPLVVAVPSLLFLAFRRSYWFAKFLFLARGWWQRDTPPLDSDSPDRTGELLAHRYLLDSRIASGGFGQVYRATDQQQPDVPLALKLIDPQLNATPHRSRQHFGLELAALQSIQHPGIISILDWGIAQDGTPFLVMPFLPGPTLRHRLSEPDPLPDPHIAALIQELTAAVESLHSRGLVHRDLKPENIILHASQPVIIDFGAATFRGPEGKLATTQVLSGSYHYLAPERLLGYYSPASDLYSLAVIFFELLSGKTAHEINEVYSQPAFLDALTNALAERRSRESALRLASLFRPAFHPDPLERPANLGAWVQPIVAELSTFPNSPTSM